MSGSPPQGVRVDRRFASGIPGAAALALAITVLAAQATAQITRVANSSLTLPQNPQTFGFQAQDAFAGITFDQPLGLATPPGETTRLFVVEKPGRIQVISALDSTPAKQLFLDLTSRVLVDPTTEEGLLGLAFHPDFARNGYFYVFYTTTATTAAGAGRHDRLSRFTALSPPATNADILATEVPLISQYDEASNHNGGDLHFGPDGYLYVGLGDEGGGNDQFGNSQRIDHDFFSGLLRIDVDQRPGNLVPNAQAAVHPGTYLVPADNPFVGATTFNGLTVNPAAVRTEFWAVGLRNPWRFSFDAPTGRLLVGDVGQSAREEVDLITRGGNYGWAYREGTIAGPKPNPPPGAAFIDPIWDADRATASSITGGVVDRGSRMAQLFGRYVFGDYGTGHLFAMSFPPTGSVQVQPLLMDSSPVGFGVDPHNGDVLYASIGTGAIRRLMYNATPTGTPLPPTLTATGAFTNLATLTPAAGIVPFEPNVSFWSDYAVKRRWFSVPALADKITFAADGNWTFPAGTVWVKHFDLDLTRGDPATARRLETRFLVKVPDGVYGVTYRWNAAQTEATLVPEEGADESITINDGGTIRTQIWHYPSRAECLQCHSVVTGGALGFRTAQLNRTFAYDAGTANQLTALANAGYFTTAGVPDPATLRALAPAGDTSATLEHRARSYLAANCVQCHQPGGAALGLWDARIETPTSSAGLIDGPLINSGGDRANRVMVPVDPAHSMLLTRISTRGAGQMPPLASNELDAADIALVTAWINSFGAPVISAQPASPTAAPGQNAIFTVMAAANPAPTYQWQRRAAGSAVWSDLADGAGFSGSRTATLTVVAVTEAMSGDAFQCVIGNTGGTITSAPAVLTVRSPLTFTTLAGLAGSSGSADGPGTNARFSGPIDLAVDGAGTIYVADTSNHIIRRITPTGDVTTLAGTAGSAGSADGTGAAARFSHPTGITVRGSGDVFVADTDNHTVRRITAAGVVTTLAGLAGVAGSGDGAGSAARFRQPCDVAVDAAGIVYVADSGNNTIRMVNAVGLVSTLAGQAGGSGGADGVGSAARFFFPQGVAADAAGNLYVADSGNNTIRRITPAGVVTTLAGAAGASGADDGTGGAARFNDPGDLTVDSTGNVYVVDTDNDAIRKVSPLGAVTTVAGLPGASGSADGSGELARFNLPSGITVDGAGTLYLADTGNHTIRFTAGDLAPAILSQPQSQTVMAGANVMFTVTAQGRPAPNYQWRFNGAAISGATSTSLNLSNAQMADAGNYTVTVTNSAGSVTSSTASLTVNTSAASGGGSAAGGGGGGGGGGAAGGCFVAALALLCAARRTARA